MQVRYQAALRPEIFVTVVARLTKNATIARLNRVCQTAEQDCIQSPRTAPSYSTSEPYPLDARLFTLESLKQRYGNHQIHFSGHCGTISLTTQATSARSPARSRYTSAAALSWQEVCLAL